MSILWYLFTLDYYIITIQRGIYHFFTIAISVLCIDLRFPRCLSV